MNISLSMTPPLFNLSTPTSSLFFYLSPCSPHSFICPSSPWQASCGQLFFFFPSISAIIAFHPAECGDGNNFTLILRADTILLWLIELPSERSSEESRSSLSHLLTGRPLYCFIDRHQQPLKLPAAHCCSGGFYCAVLLVGIADRQSKGHPGITGDGIPVTVPLYSTVTLETWKKICVLCSGCCEMWEFVMEFRA